MNSIWYVSINDDKGIIEVEEKFNSSWNNCYKVQGTRDEAYEFGKFMKNYLNLLDAGDITKSMDDKLDKMMKKYKVEEIETFSQKGNRKMTVDRSKLTQFSKLMATNFGDDDNYGDTQNVDGIDREAVFEAGMSTAHEIFGDETDEAIVRDMVDKAIDEALRQNGDTQVAIGILKNMFTKNASFSKVYDEAKEKGTETTRGNSTTKYYEFKSTLPASVLKEFDPKAKSAAVTVSIGPRSFKVLAYPDTEDSDDPVNNSKVIELMKGSNKDFKSLNELLNAVSSGKFENAKKVRGFSEESDVMKDEKVQQAIDMAITYLKEKDYDNLMDFLTGLKG